MENERRENPEGAENVATDRIIGAAIEVHRVLGPGLLESVYEECLCYEMSVRGLRFQRQLPLPIVYKGVKFENQYKLDLMVEDSVIVEVKAVEECARVHYSQLLTYLRLLNKRVGLLINFDVPVLKDGLKRVVNNYVGPALPPQEPPRVPPRLRVSASDEEPLAVKEVSF